MSMNDKSIRLISWNVKGMNNNVKANKVISHLQDLEGDLFFLQETHLRKLEFSRIKKPWMGHLFHSRFSERARGAAIIVHKDVAFESSSVVSDPNGRNVIVQGKLQNTPVVLASIYAPTWDDDKFMSKIFSNIPNAADHHIIIGGDFNQVQDLDLDRSSTSQSSLSKATSMLKFHADQLGLSDPWRTMYPHTKAFSFFSHVHRSYSRIYFFLLDNRLLDNIQSCEYHSIVISDHSPITLNINLSQDKLPTKPWRFNSHLLSEPKFKDYLTNQIQLFFDTNDTPDIGSGVLWETLKAYLRGQIISFISGFRREERTKLKQISDEIQLLDAQYSVNPSDVLYKKRVQLQSQYNLLTSGRIEKQLLHTKQRFFEQGDKAGKLLAYQARTERVISALINPDQTGFILGRHSSSNTRRLLNVLYSPPTDSPELVLSLDAEKAFDRVEWKYLFFTLNKFGLSPDF
uniref:Endonuclease/exonuclease/phosphatase domain-containing protein n=1 Tax=Takifugu rubripes TaxID=31033 RepID=A0A674MN32_TAKRU